MLARRREYSFDEWTALTPEARVELMLHYWDPQRPTIGERTRLGITDAFAAAYPSLADHALATTCQYRGALTCFPWLKASEQAPGPRLFTPRDGSDGSGGDGHPASV